MYLDKNLNIKIYKYLLINSGFEMDLSQLNIKDKRDYMDL
ncbi:protein of unknown function [Clostridium beijerinckii]|nr:protein of unknown function [Clostridium beijerinckii]